MLAVFHTGLLAVIQFLRNSNFTTAPNVLCHTCKIVMVVLIWQKNPQPQK
jgi:hypothetical protein